MSSLPEPEIPSSNGAQHLPKTKIIRTDDEQKRIVEKIQARVLHGGMLVRDACKLEGVTKGEYNGWREKHDYPTVMEQRKRERGDEFTDIVNDVKGDPFSELKRERDQALGECAELRRECNEANYEKAKMFKDKNREMTEKIKAQEQCVRLQEENDRIRVQVKKMREFSPDLLALDSLINDEIFDDIQG